MFPSERARAQRKPATSYRLAPLDERHRLRRDRRPFADRTEALVGLRLDAYTINIDFQDTGQLLAHGLNVRLEFGLFSHHRGVEVDDEMGPPAWPSLGEMD